jgi:hypothetical protein
VLGLTHEAPFVPGAPPVGHELGKLELHTDLSQAPQVETGTDPTKEGAQEFPLQHVHLQHGPLEQAAGAVVAAEHGPAQEYTASRRLVAEVVVKTSIRNCVPSIQPNQVVEPAVERSTTSL